jgi:hypothetical protein
MLLNDLEKKVLKEVSDYHDKTNGKCGISAMLIAEQLNMSFLELRETFNDLNDKKAFTIRKGINSILIFKK